MEKWVGEYGLERTLLDMSTWQEIPVQPDEKHDYESLVVTPNRRQMTYLTFLESDGFARFQELIIADAYGQQLKGIPWEGKWFSVVDWVDNEQIMVRLVAMENGEISYGYPGPRLVIDTLSGEQKVLEPDLLPGWEEWIDATHEYVQLPFWDSWRGVVYDPSLTRVIYPIINEEDADRYTYALWDVSQQKPVTTLDPIINFNVKENYYPRPDWSPGGSQFVLVGGVVDTDTGDVVGNELFRVTRDGQIEQITHVGEFASVWASSHSWSPDGRYIALFLNPIDRAINDARLVVLDTVTMNLTDYCFTVNVKFDSSEAPAPVWSPDGTQLLLENKFIGDRSQVIWVDLENGVAARLINDEYIAGWMLAPEEATSTNQLSEEQLLMQIYETNGGCELPCYWGIISGVTKWEDASESLSNIGEIFGPVSHGDIDHYGSSFGDPNWEIGMMSAGFFVENDKVIAITSRCDRVRPDMDNSLSGLLEEFGKPEEIWVRVVTETQMDQPYYYMVLRYPSIGLYVEWDDDTVGDEDDLSICPQDSINRNPHTPWLVLWDPEKKASFREFGLSVLGDDLGKITDEYELLGDVSVDRMTNEEFFEMYSKEGMETCIPVMQVQH